MYKFNIPKGQLQSNFSYKWECSCQQKNKNCNLCFNYDLEKIKKSLKNSRRKVYYCNLKAFLKLEGQNIYKFAQNIINETGKFTPTNLLEITDKFLFRSRTKIITEWLEETGIIPPGTYQRLKDGQFKPTKCPPTK